MKQYFGNCTQADVVEELFGSVSIFACLVEEHGNQFTYNGIQVRYKEELDIHEFYCWCLSQNIILFKHDKNTSILPR